MEPAAYKDEIVNFIWNTTNLKKKDAEKAVDAMLRFIADVLKQGNEVKLIRFGIFRRIRLVETEKRVFSGEIIKVPEHYTIKFYPSKSLKDYVNKQED